VSEPEDFVTRWSRRKREAAQAPPPAEPQSEARDAAAAPAPQSAAPAAAPAEPSVDLSALPPIDQITATTDIRAYLAPGVPAELTRAALRRAWVADPAIRDFVGIAENQWDFNDPHGVPGFGPLEDVGRLLAQALGDGEQPAAPAATPLAAADPPCEVRGEAAALPPDALATAGDTASVADDGPGPEARSSASMPAGAPVVAPQQADDVPAAAHRGRRRGHGGALPQ